MVAGVQALGAASAGVVAPVVMSGVALAGDYVMRVDMPKLPDMPKMPSLPKLSLPSLPKTKAKGKAAPKEAIFVDDNPNAATVAKKNVQIRVNSSSSAPSAPTLQELKKGDGAAVVIGEGREYRVFPGRRMPGANMSGFMDMAKDIGPK